MYILVSAYVKEYLVIGPVEGINYGGSFNYPSLLYH
jgi:hypothetical protein